MLKSDGCSSGRSSTPWPLSQLFTSVPGELMPSYGLHGYCMHVVHRHPFRKKHFRQKHKRKYLKNCTWLICGVLFICVFLRQSAIYFRMVSNSLCIWSWGLPRVSDHSISTSTVRDYRLEHPHQVYAELENHTLNPLQVTRRCTNWTTFSAQNSVLIWQDL